ncbi:hypothetical protein MHBO_000501 [Bonamia ostreae]|uniref:Uncharacterized protein n=1 Tax=Bonamia ostreae TaxID=126728 RepID=A0ABV2AFS6_9EUKA
MWLGFLSLRNILQNLPGFKEIFGLLFKLILSGPGILATILIIALCFSSAFTEYLENNQIVFLNIVFILPGFIQVLAVPELIQTIIEVIPFIDFTIMVHDGYYYAVYAYSVMLFTLLVLMIDGISKPIPPLRPVELDDQMCQDNEEVCDPLHMEDYVSAAQTVVAKRVLNDEVNFAL